jgi:hypothetical protein
MPLQMQTPSPQIQMASQIPQRVTQHPLQMQMAPQMAPQVQAMPEPDLASMTIKSSVLLTVLFVLMSHHVAQHALAGVVGRYVTMFDAADVLTWQGTAVTAAAFLVAVYVASKVLSERLV